MRNFSGPEKIQNPLLVKAHYPPPLDQKSVRLVVIKAAAELCSYRIDFTIYNDPNVLGRSPC